jgi:aspartyl-tRNA(Asn)/glutamyl-tRNA(Gln) amidotransferase subunit B
MQWETVIGIETHTQLSTKSKIFSGASTAFGAPPNAQACTVDIALPGVLPVLNGAAVEKALRFGLAVGAHINRRSVFARKNYFYPDLPKGYQISQYELPIVQGGSLAIVVGSTEKTVRLTRAHLEEDAGKSLHEGIGTHTAANAVSGIDLNRAGTPLLEIVSEPDMHSSAEAVAYAKALHALVRWIGICDGNMQEGSFRCDANVSVRRAGEPLGTRCEIKNLNSFRFLERAIEFEVARQIEVIEDGGRVVQETRLYDPERDQTRPMRSKEDAHDYRYFPDPDLLPLDVSAQMLERIQREMPELPPARRARYMHDYELSAYDAALLTQSRETADYFEAAFRALDTGDKVAGAKQLANLINGEMAALLNRDGLEVAAMPISASALAGLVKRNTDNTLSSKMSKEVLQAMWEGEGTADQIIEKRGLKQISDSGELERVIDGILAANPAQVAEYRAGKEKAFNFFVGQAMKATKGKANPQQLNDILRRKLAP